jgi:hypothetical protein
MNDSKKSTAKIVALFALVGGLGIPLLFVLLWQVMRRILQGQVFIDAMEWFESFRLMFWPSAMLLIYRPGAEAQQWAALLIAVVANVGIYALIGLSVGLALRHRLAQIGTLVVLLAIMYGLNSHWSRHLPSFVVSAILVIVLFVLLIRSQRGTGQAHTPTR